MKVGEFNLGAVDATEYLCRAYTLRNPSETRIKESHDTVAIVLAASLNIWDNLHTRTAARSRG